jgi:DNA-directed RNA polymerase specialized sigma24 family protein
MATEGTSQIDEVEARLVMRAQAGDRGAFDELYERHAHPAWRLALAVGASSTIAEDAVAQGFTAALRRLKRGTATLAMPFRLQAARASAEVAASAARHHDAPVDPPPNDLVAAFRRLPERWRAGLWLTAVEGGNPGQVAPVLALSAEATVSLVHRAAAGLRERYARAGGPPLDDIREAIPALRALVVPLPDTVQDDAVAQWQAWMEHAARDGRHGLASVIPFGPWSERAVAGTAAGIFAAGVACMIALTSGPNAANPQLASPATATATGRQVRHASGTNSSSGSATSPTTSPTTTVPAFADGQTYLVDPAVAGTGGGTMTSAAASGAAPARSTASAPGAPPSGSAPAATSSSSPSSPPPSSSSPAPTTTPAPAPPAPAPAPAAPASPGVSAGTSAGGIGVSAGAGSGGTGVSAGGTTVGTPPPPPSGGTTVTIDTGVAPPVTVALPH